jgi:hypothetical protein
MEGLSYPLDSPIQATLVKKQPVSYSQISLNGTYANHVEVHILTPYFSTIHFNIILHTMSRSPKRSSPFRSLPFMFMSSDQNTQSTKKNACISNICNSGKTTDMTTLVLMTFIIVPVNYDSRFSSVKLQLTFILMLEITDS